ncbi:alpha-ketoglutarate dependent xanthine dioxygenase [Pyrenophora seminiperda CCB06]|uniref:Alpha-ketoglutarate dependent xanthine dioxygenase n=1 Tax=Pyrenophora seminiperda CCB06 TaxID=1302712 RepID=A0A3M7M0E1_9PLEO|nr:alpha-ketoglutarate dependent xanthine dioxygenase [Pyrenophora seminiperda CCB06]
MQVKQLRQATWEHKLLIIKGQKDLEPKRGWELLQQLDPDSKKIDNTTFARAFYPKDGIVAAIKYVEVPDAGAFVFIGKGPQDDPRYGKPGLNMGGTNFNQYYSKPLADADFEAGKTRFHWWHTDGTYFQHDPPTFTMLRPIKFPTEGKKTQTVEWADDSGLSMEVKPGRTAFVDVEQLYDMLSDEEKKTMDHSWVEYMYWPYEWIKGCRGAPNGLGVANEGKEVPDEEMAKIEEMNKDWQKKYPLVWVNPATGKKSFQVQHNLARRLFLRNGPNDTPKVIDDLGEVRKFLDNIQGRMIKPEHIWVGPEEEHDMLLFQNYGLFHTKIDYPANYGVRTVHQGWLPGGKPPAGPVPIPE